MNLHEYQSKELFAQYAIPIPKGQVADSPEAAVAAAKGLGGSLWVVKAQVHAGGRGKAGGVKVVKDLEAVRSGRQGDAGHHPGDASDRARRLAGPSGVCGSGFEDRARDLLELGAESRRGTIWLSLHPPRAAWTSKRSRSTRRRRSFAST